MFYVLGCMTLINIFNDRLNALLVIAYVLLLLLHKSVLFISL